MKIAVNLWLWSALAMVHCFDPKKVDYCKTPCKNGKHSEKHTACGGCPLKKQHTEVLDNLVEFRKDMVRLHNEFRNKIASGGEEGQYGFPSAANMMAVNYDLEMEYIARCHARQITKSHDKCRTPEKYDYAGQNIYYSTKKDLKADPVKPWYNEISLVSGDKKALVSHFVFSKNTGHFTQVVWATVTVIGCARVWAENIDLHFVIICNYAGKDGSGNMENAPIYQIGTPCSKCPQGCNKEYPALCGEVQPIPTADPYKDIGSAGVGRGNNNRKSLLSSQVFILVFVAAKLISF